MEEIRPREFKKPVNQKVSNDVLAEHHRIPPQALELEEAVLGAMMLEKDAVTTVIEILKPEAFYKHAHQLIFAAIYELFQQSQPIDLLTVTHLLRNKGQLDMVGGAYYLSLLTNRVGSGANVEFHARIILEKHLKRELIRIASEIQRDAYDDGVDVFDLLDSAEKKLFDVAQGNIKRTSESMNVLISEALNQIEQAQKQESTLTGVPSGFTKLDELTAGWQKSDLIIVAARPAMGKTAFCLSMARNAAVDFNVPVAVFSLEMSAVQLVNRLISAETGIPSDKLRKGNLTEQDWQNLHSRLTDLAEAPIYINDTPALNIFEFRAIARRMKQHQNIGMIIIDYLQLMTAGDSKKGGIREQEISTISRSLKAIAKELNIPIIALSQLSRAVESRPGDKRPQLSDLRESGAIEQDADMVCFIYRPEYYGILEDEGQSMAGVAKIIVAKHRNGATDDVALQFIGEQARFTNLPMDSQSFYTSKPLPANSKYDPSQNTVTVPSRMNEEFDDIDDDIPF